MHETNISVTRLTHMNVIYSSPELAIVHKIFAFFKTYGCVGVSWILIFKEKRIILYISFISFF